MPSLRRTLLAIAFVASSTSSIGYAQVDTVRVSPGSQILLIIEEGPPPTPDPIPTPNPFVVSVQPNGPDSVIVRAEGYAVPGADVSYAWIGTYVSSRWENAKIVDWTVFESRQSRTFSSDSVRRYLTVRSIRQGVFSEGEETVYFWVVKDSLPVPPDTLPPPLEPPADAVGPITRNVVLSDSSAEISTSVPAIPRADSVVFQLRDRSAGGVVLEERRTTSYPQVWTVPRIATDRNVGLRYWGLNEAGEGSYRDDNLATIPALPPDTTPPPDPGPDPIFAASNVTAATVYPGADLKPTEGTLILEYDTPSPAGLFSRDHVGYGAGGHLSVFLTAGDTLRVRIQDDSTSYEINVPNAAGARTASVTFGDGLKVYLDGALAGQDPYSGGLCCTEKEIVVGGLQWNSPPDSIRLQWPIEDVGGAVLETRLFDEILPDSLLSWLPPIEPPPVDTIPPIEPPDPTPGEYALEFFPYPHAAPRVDLEDPTIDPDGYVVLRWAWYPSRHYYRSEYSLASALEYWPEADHWPEVGRTTPIAWVLRIGRLDGPGGYETFVETQLAGGAEKEYRFPIPAPPTDPSCCPIVGGRISTWLNGGEGGLDWGPTYPSDGPFGEIFFVWIAPVYPNDVPSARSYSQFALYRG